MTNCCLSMLRGIWSFLMGSMRMVLFFMCLFYTIVHLFLVFSVFSKRWADDYMDLPGATATLSDKLVVLASLFLGILGCYGAFYKHHPSIRTFAFLSSLNVILLSYLLITTMHPGELKQDIDEYTTKLRGYMPDYDWTRDHLFDYIKERATDSWDAAQRLMCCGVDGPKEWEKYRPSGEEYEKAYPRTCCLDTLYSYNGICTKERRLFHTGCSERLHQVMEMAVWLSGFMIFYQLALSIIAYIVGCCSFEPRERHVGVVLTPRTVYTDTVPQSYQQPAVNREFVPAPKQSLPPMYPNLHGSSNTNYTAPPPSYGT